MNANRTSFPRYLLACLVRYLSACPPLVHGYGVGYPGHDFARRSSGTKVRPAEAPAPRWSQYQGA